MNRVTVEFFGICTFVSPEHFPQLRVRQRVVLVNGEDTYVRRVKIPSHEAHLHLDGKKIRLEGVHLALEVESAAHPPFRRELEALPRLSELMKEVEPLSPPSPQVVAEPTASEAACIFDITFGTLTVGLNSDQAAFTTLTAESEGTFVLKARPLEGGKLPPHLAPSTRLEGQSALALENTDVHTPKKTMLDFLLHYKTAAQMPEVPQIPQIATLQRIPTQQPLHSCTTIGAGCSNSNYP